MSDAPRPMPGRPSLRYLKLEAKRRLAAGEFPALHDAQLVIAREHGVSSWTALKQLISDQGLLDSHVLAQLRWIAARFHDAGQPGWTPPDEAQLRQHFSDTFLSSRPAGQLEQAIARYAAGLGDDVVVLAQSPLTVRVEIGGLQVFASAEPEPPHKINAMWPVPGGRRITDPRAAPPVPVRAVGDVPAWACETAEAALEELGVPGVVLAGQRMAPWIVAAGWADLDRREALHTGHSLAMPGVTALVTTTAVLRLIGDGRIGMDAPANGYLRSVRLADDTITVRELLSNTSGAEAPLTGPLLTDSVPALADLTGPVIACGGSRGALTPSNCGYAVLGQLVADVTALPYREAATELVLAPLAMTRSIFPWRVADLPADAVTGYEVTADGVFEPVPASVVALPAVGGMRAPAADVLRLGTGWASLLPEELAREALTPQAGPGPGGLLGGLGWLLTSRRDIAVHSGAVPGAGAMLLYRIPDNQVYVTMTTRFVPVDSITRRLLRERASGMKLM